MDTIEIRVAVAEDAAQELLIAELSDLDFEGFVQEDDGLRAYIAAPRWDDVRREHIGRWLRANGFDAQIDEQAYEPQNWNATWEATIQPVEVGRFWIKPTWAGPVEAEADQIVLEIDPKMSFGTGYHETTRLMLRWLPRFVETGARVLDAGSGTGVLAIAAVKLGAAHALAFDIDEWAQENVVENLYLNGVVDDVVFREGSIEVVDESGFDLVLANINRTALLEMMPRLAEITRTGGHVLLAGILLGDREVMLDACRAQGLTLVDEAAEGEWLSLALVRA